MRLGAAPVGSSSSSTPATLTPSSTTAASQAPVAASEPAGRSGPPSTSSATTASAAVTCRVRSTGVSGSALTVVPGSFGCAPSRGVSRAASADTFQSTADTQCSTYTASATGSRPSAGRSPGSSRTHSGTVPARQGEPGARHWVASRSKLTTVSWATISMVSSNEPSRRRARNTPPSTAAGRLPSGTGGSIQCATLDSANGNSSAQVALARPPEVMPLHRYPSTVRGTG